MNELDTTASGREGHRPGRPGGRAVPFSGAASDLSADIVQMPKRRTYLDECRARGVFQQREELLAETAELRASVAALKGETGADIMPITKTGSPAVTSHALTVQRDEILGRVRAICASYQASGCLDRASDTFRLFQHLLTETQMSAEAVAGCFEATLQDLSRRPEPDGDLYEQGRTMSAVPVPGRRHG